MLANSCGVLSPSQSPRPYAGSEDGLSTCIQAAIAPLQTGFFEPTLISSNRNVFSTIAPKSVFPISVGCAYQNVVATAVRFTTPANRQAGSIRLWQLNRHRSSSLAHSERRFAQRHRRLPDWHLRRRRCSSPGAQGSGVWWLAVEVE